MYLVRFVLLYYLILVPSEVFSYENYLNLICKKDKLTRRHCIYLKRSGYCKENGYIYEGIMKDKCYRTCGHCHCQDFAPVVNICRQNKHLCVDTHGGDSVVTRWLRRNCYRTCQICGRPRGPPRKVCRDELRTSVCRAWQTIEKCRVPYIRTKYCAKTCGHCSEEIT